MKQVFALRINTPSVNEASGALADALNGWFTSYGPSILYKNCDNCRHMAENGPAHCGKYNMTPPASVIVAGCQDHFDKEDIPF